MERKNFLLTINKEYNRGILSRFYFLTFKKIFRFTRILSNPYLGKSNRLYNSLSFLFQRFVFELAFRAGMHRLFYEGLIA